MRAEAAEAAGSAGNGRPAIHDLERLPYTAQVVNEAMRLYLPAHTVVRRADDDTELLGLPGAEGPHRGGEHLGHPPPAHGLGGTLRLLPGAPGGRRLPTGDSTRRSSGYRHASRESGMSMGAQLSRAAIAAHLA